MKLKWSLFIVAGMMSTSAFAQEAKEVRQESRKRVTGERLIYVGACSDVKITTSKNPAIVYNKDGSMRRNSQGEVVTKEMTTITATANRELGKCQTVETYQVNVTGSMWNSDTKEIANSGVSSSSVGMQTKSYSQSQEIDMNALDKVAGNNGSIFGGGSNPAQLLINFTEGLKAIVKQECEAATAELNLHVVAKASTGCR